MKTSCIVCKNNKFKYLFKLKNYNLMECSNCSLQKLEPQPSLTELDKIYSNYYDKWNYNNSNNQISNMKKLTFSEYLKQITKFISSGKLLDVGCATGDLLSAAQSMGFDVYGAEVSKQGLDICRKKFGKNKIFESHLITNNIKKNSFDIIILSDVIEHIVEIDKFIESIWNALKDNGFLMLTTPDTNSISKKLMQSKWFHYKIEHLYYFNNSNIKTFLNPKFEILINKKVYKTLNLGYILSLLDYYSNNKLKFINQLTKFIPNKLLYFNFKIHFGEMFILCRKRTL
mgnify:FL=1